MTPHRRAVFVCCDGLGRSWVTPEHTPILAELAGRSLWCGAHRAVFPSVTRSSAASVATGCHPGRHGLHGNRMGLFEDGRIVVRDVGSPDFRDYMRRATGRTLCVPTVAERVAAAGGFVAFSNVSPGAAYFLDPEHFGFVYHRAGSFAPGGAALAAPEALAVSHDAAGDWAMTERFCAEVLGERKPSAAILWLADPDHTLHNAELGSPEHRDALAAAERCVGLVVATVKRLRAAGEDILLLVGSDHGQESVGGCIEIEGWLGARGFADDLAEGRVAVATQGTAALLYATDEAEARLLALLPAMAEQPWAGGIAEGDGLARLGHAATGGVVAAVNMARRDEINPHGVPGMRWRATEPGQGGVIGWGQHGGWGPDETQPFLLLNVPAISAGKLGQPSSLVDIAPTMLDWLGLSFEGTDGRPLLPRQTV